MNHDDRVGLPPENYRLRPVEEIAGLFNEFAETIAEIVTPDDTESALQNLLDRLKSDQDNRPAWVSPSSSVGHSPRPSKVTRHAPDEAANPIPEGAGRHPLPGDTIGGQARAAADHDDMGPVGTLPHRGGTPRMEGTADRKSDHAWPDTALLAGTTAPRPAGASLVQSRDIGRAADRTVEALAPLAVFGRDLRMNPGDREETQALLAGARELLSRCPAGARLARKAPRWSWERWPRWRRG